jgi:hypothetical protein
MRHGACFSVSPMRSLRLASLVAAVLLALGARDASADDARAVMARALEEQADVQPPPAILPVRALLVDAPARTTAPPTSTGLARAATAAANAAESARGLARALAHAARAAWAASDAASDQAAKARGHGNERPGRGLKR